MLVEEQDGRGQAPVVPETVATSLPLHVSGDELRAMDGADRSVSVLVATLALW